MGDIKIGIIDNQMGNITSVVNAIKSLGLDCVISSSTSKLDSLDWLSKNYIKKTQIASSPPNEQRSDRNEQSDVGCKALWVCLLKFAAQIRHMFKD